MKDDVFYDSFVFRSNEEWLEFLYGIVDRKDRQEIKRRMGQAMLEGGYFCENN